MTKKQSLKRKKIVPGEYEHYKGNKYTVLGVAYHSENLEPFVVYSAAYGKKDIWVRPHSMFFEKVTVDGKKMPRFKLLKKKK